MRLRYLILPLAASLACSSCMSLGLERHTVNQAISVTDLRYQEILNNLAMVAVQPGVIPSYALCATGTVNLTRTYGLESQTTFDHAVFGFSKQLLGLSVRDIPDQSWTLDPVVSEPQLKALSAAFLWALRGPPPEGSPAMELLRAARWQDDPGYHFAVADQLANLPTGWVHFGGVFDVPPCACYKGHCGELYAWVEPIDLKALSIFTLAILDISTVDVNTLGSPGRKVTVERFLNDQSSTITETWMACQEAPDTDSCRRNVKAGPITIQRPKTELSQPDVTIGACNKTVQIQVEQLGPDGRPVYETRIQEILPSPPPARQIQSYHTPLSQP
jgi:hypothetical protein